MIELQNIEKSYGSKKALNDISFTIGDGNIVGLIGSNGAGKSTLMNIITGYFPATAGNVLIDGVSIDEDPDKARAKIGYLPEKPPVYEMMTVKEFLKYVGGLKGIPKKDLNLMVYDVLHKIELMNVENRLIRNLSKGYQQRVGIAQAMLGNPEILILDEPTVGLDPTQVMDFRNVLKEYGKDHIIFISSHILSEIGEICDRIIMLNEGHLIMETSLAELAERNKNNLVVRVECKKDEFEAILEASGIQCDYSYRGEGEPGCSEWDISATSSDEDIRRKIFNLAKEKDIVLLSMSAHATEVEDIFMNAIDKQ